ncbi:MAG: polysaccharide biosynthesis protein, partial [Thermodesulfobacteriota bacterium]|nr:polysaccharide biosynthesis protein [Thermodesulfobacteriota bacterium]
PVFIQQRAMGEITITDKRMTRFWITLDQAVALVIDGLHHMQGGEIFVPKIPSMKIIDLAGVVAPECAIEVIGIRPGEKLHETLITEEDGRNTVSFNGMYVIMPNYSWWERENYKDGKALPPGFVYTSDSNAHWLTKKDLERIVYGPSFLEVCPCSKPQPDADQSHDTTLSEITGSLGYGHMMQRQ